MQTPEKVAIAVALIGLVGTIAAAVITSDRDWFGDRQQNGSGIDKTNTAGPVVPAGNAAFAPHAPPIEVGGHVMLWGEQTKLLTLQPGEHAKLLAQELYTHATTYPGLSCAGPGYVPYTWQVRDPYPEGGDLEIRDTIKQSGGNTQQVAMGAKGRLDMGGCDEHFLYNRGLRPMKVEVRYASAVDEEAAAEYHKAQDEAEAAATDAEAPAPAAEGQ